MATTMVPLLLLLLVSMVTASHYFGGSMSFAYKGRNPDGTFRVEIRNRDTFERCFGSFYSHNWRCYGGNCGYNVRSQSGAVEQSSNAPRYNSQWCETATVSTRNLWSNKPFQMRENSCCWIPTRNSISSWNLETSLDFGIRSDTGEPNKSPDIATLPFLRVPQNCPRSYNLSSFDPDGDRVRCRYRTSGSGGFHLDQDSCTFHYLSASANPRVLAVELVVEDYPQRPISLAYSDGSSSYRAPLHARRRRQAWWWGGHSTTAPPHHANWWWWGHTTTTPSPPSHQTNNRWWGNPTPAPTQPAQAVTPWWWWWGHTTTAPPHHANWWWWGHTTPAPTQPAQAVTPWWWWWGHTTTTPSPPSHQTNNRWWWGNPTTTPSPPSHQTNNRWWWGNPTPAPTQPAQAVTPWWWWWGHTTTTPSPPSHQTNNRWWGNPTPAPTQPAQTTTTTPSPPSHQTNNWWWWGHTTTTPTQPAQTTTPWWWWWGHTTTTPTPTRATSGPTTPPYNTFPQHVTIPLSKLPLQFSLLVDPPAPSCQEGLYLPKFVHPTPENAAHIQAEVNKEMEIRVRAQAAYATIHDMIISGPLNISKHRTTNDEFVIRWTPTADNLGEHFPVCFAVEATTGSISHVSHNHGIPTSQSGVYQSDMRCVVVDVKAKQYEAHVICGESSMRVEVEKSSFSGLHEDHLQLSDPSSTACSLQRHSNSTHVIAVFPLNACGTQIEEDNENLIFKNEITTVDDRRDLITRKHLVEVRFKCQYAKEGNVTAGFSAHRDNVTVWEKGLGTFTYQFEFYPDNQFRTRIDPSSYPLEYDVGSRIYMEIEATSQINNTELFVESCRAAPYDNPNYWPTYPIIENGCAVDSTVMIHSSNHQRHFRFCMEAFKFIGLHDQVYISCSVLMCEAGAPGTRCSQGCINSTLPAGHRHHHRKREAVTQTSRHLISQGPLRLRRSAERTEGPGVNVNLNLVFIAGCLLAAIGMICGVVMYKAKVSKVKYQPLPVCES